MSPIKQPSAQPKQQLMGHACQGRSQSSGMTIAPAHAPSTLIMLAHFTLKSNSFLQLHEKYKITDLEKHTVHYEFTTMELCKLGSSEYRNPFRNIASENETTRKEREAGQQTGKPERFGE